MMLLHNAGRALAATVLLAVLTGLAYPLAVTGVAQVAFSHKANGSLIRGDGRVLGSSLIGQRWQGPQWFYGRPSATGAGGYDAAASAGSNLGPTSARLASQVRQRAQAILALEGPYHPGMDAADIPVDLLTASASGLDPDISPAAADLQAPRVAAARGLPLARVRALVRAYTQGRSLGVLGEPRVNVLELNLALQRASR